VGEEVRNTVALTLLILVSAVNAITLSYSTTLVPTFTPDTVAFSNDGILAVAGSNDIVFYDQSFNVISTYTLPSGSIIMGSSYNNGYFAFVTWDGDVYVFDKQGNLYTSSTFSSLNSYNAFYDVVLYGDYDMLVSGASGLWGANIWGWGLWSYTQQVPPGGVAVYTSGSNAYVYVADYSNNRVNILDGSTGATLGYISVTGPSVLAACGGYLAVGTDS
jgi:DNA-binding beta-propeller fold protein YncE